VPNMNPAGWIRVSSGPDPFLTFMSGNPNAPHSIVAAHW